MKLKGPIGPRSPGQQAEFNIHTHAIADETLESFDQALAVGVITYGTMMFQLHPAYDSLPDGIKIAFSPRDYSVMPDEEKKTLVHDITHPEVWED